MTTRRKTRASNPAPSSANKESARAAIGAYLRTLDETRDRGDHAGLYPTWHQPRPDEWTISIVGSSHQNINVELSLGEYTLRFMSFFMRKPDENIADVYRTLLRRNLELSTVKFGIDDFGDIYLRADLPLSSVIESHLDRLIGVFYSCADDNYLPVMRLGFASAIKR